MHAFTASLAILLAQQGHLDHAAEMARTSREFVESRNERWAETSTCIAEALVAHGGGDLKAARERLAAGRDLALGQGAFAMVPVIEAAAAELGLALEPLDAVAGRG
jgi:hypothetical protein